MACYAPLSATSSESVHAHGFVYCVQLHLITQIDFEEIKNYKYTESNNYECNNA